MLEQGRFIDFPAYEFFQDRGIEEGQKELQRREAQDLRGNYTLVRYRSRAELEEEKEELAIVGEYNNLTNLKNMTFLFRDGNMKEFYKVANRVLRIHTNNPVVRKIKKEVNGEEDIVEDKILVEEAIASYFKQIYQRPVHMQGRREKDEEMKSNEEEL